jgi:hypothetical protein
MPPTPVLGTFQFARSPFRQPEIPQDGADTSAAGHREGVGAVKEAAPGSSVTSCPLALYWSGSFPPGSEFSETQDAIFGVEHDLVVRLDEIRHQGRQSEAEVDVTPRPQQARRRAISW